MLELQGLCLFMWISVKWERTGCKGWARGGQALDRASSEQVQTQKGEEWGTRASGSTGASVPMLACATRRSESPPSDTLFFLFLCPHIEAREIFVLGRVFCKSAENAAKPPEKHRFSKNWHINAPAFNFQDFRKIGVFPGV